MTDHDSTEPLEIRVLAALTSGPLTVADVTLRTGAAEIQVGSLLEDYVRQEMVTRIKLSKAPAYSLTPKGLHSLGVFQGVQSSAVVDRPADPAPQLTVEPSPPVLPTPPASVLPSLEVSQPNAPRKIEWRHLLYAVLYVVIGLVVTMFQPVVGILAIVVGVGLGAWTLRPFFTERG